MAASVDVVTLSKASSLPVMALHSASWGCAAAGENRAPASVMEDDGDVMRHYLLEGIVVAVCGFSLVLLQGNPRSSPGSDDDGATCVVLPFGASFLEQLLDGGGSWWSGVHLPR